jgi:uncharacterized protein YdaU (DUF1376 family)
VNYYKFNIGDYAAATRHLTMLEHGAYRMLLDVYYTTEQPLPVEVKSAARKAGARTKDEIAAVEIVLNEFFTLTENGWIQKRCESEIAVYQQKAETNKVVGKLGGRPKKQTQTVSDGNQEITQTVSENNPQETLTTNHKPLTIINKEKDKKKAVSADAPPDGVSDSVWQDFIAIRKTKKAALTATAIKLIQSQADKAGVTLQSALETCCERGWASYNVDWLKNSNGSAHSQPTETTYQRSMRLRVAEFVPSLAKNAPIAQVPTEIMEVFDVAARRLG